MSLPICEVCAKTGLLCRMCEKNLQEGKISEIDVELSKILFEMDFEDIGFERSIETESSIIVLVSNEKVGKLIGRDGTNIKNISKRLGKPVRIIGTGNFDEMVVSLAAPAKVVEINRVLRSDGTTLRRIRLREADKSRLRMGYDDLKRVITSLSEHPVDIVFN
ncbi:MAG: KH domain-containing protein [Candidatus Altiarchaeota archaeon]